MSTLLVGWNRAWLPLIYLIDTSGIIIQDNNWDERVELLKENYHFSLFPVRAAMY